MITVNLNDINYRYDVYQIINLFYNLEEIEFIEKRAEININVTDEKVFIFSKAQEHKCEFAFCDAITRKVTIKKAVYTYLSEVTNKEFPWGTLVGIRPSKIALNLIKDGLSEKEIIQYYMDQFKTRHDKAKLCIDVAKLEQRIVNNDEKTVSVYIGMPFCPTRCVYCSFASNPIASCGSLVEPYLQALRKDILRISEFIKEKKLKIQCVYFGGGTPTSVNDIQFDEIMAFIYDKLIAAMDVEEFTVECGRPDSITESKLMSMKRNGVHRISINPQTMNDETLKKIGRHHTSEEVVEKFNLARRLGFNNINMDIIVGLEGESLSSIEYTCDKISTLKPDSITVHGLSIKRSSKLHENKITNKEDNNNIDDYNETNLMYEKTAELAKNLNMKPYYMYRQKNTFGNMENVGYSLQGKEGIYNIQMIEERQTIIAAGADAVTKVVFMDENRLERFANVKDVTEYINRIDEMLDKKTILLKSLYQI
jgi:oxygen-independent coproporphyrinogen-3 oxidase